MLHVKPSSCCLPTYLLNWLHFTLLVPIIVLPVAFMESIAPETYEASGQGLLLFVRGLGASIGLLLGGVVQQTIGGRGLYAILSCLVSFGLLIFVITTACTSTSTSTVARNRTKEGKGVEDEDDDVHTLTFDETKESHALGTGRGVYVNDRQIDRLLSRPSTFPQ